jgi:rhodanese-related sulfurtransferase
MEKREFKNAVYGELSIISKALANPNRLEIIDLLAQKEFSVEEIANQTSMSLANASQHLQTLKAARLVNSVRNGHYINYKLANESVFKVWKALREFGIERNAEIRMAVEDFRKDKGTLESVTLDELSKREDFRNHIFLDVRPKGEYDSGTIPNAISIPIEELNERFIELPRDKKIVAFCRGPICAFADEAIQLLNEKGYRAVRLEEGYPDWKDNNQNNTAEPA